VNVLKPNLRISIQTLLDAGKAQREIARVLEVDRKTIRRIDGGSILSKPTGPLDR
jgi:IS30 family transposase